jgi:hypothetical protein
LKKTCTVKSKSKRSDLDNNPEIVLYIEDHIQLSNISDARQLTDKIFSDNSNFIKDYDYKGYKVSWSWYHDIFQFCIIYLELEGLIKTIERLDIQQLKIEDILPKHRKVLELYFLKKHFPSKQKFNLNIIQILFNAFMLIFTIMSTIFFALRSGKNIGTYTGDFIYKDTKSDFRLNHLYEKYKENNVQFIEFIRPTSIKNFYVNIFKRKRFAIYYTSIIYFVDLFTRKTETNNQPKNFTQEILYKYHRANIVLLKSTQILETILKILRIDKFVLISFSSRSAHLAVAAKSLGIKTIGIMHGLDHKDYAVFMFMESYREEKKIGLDVFGVWSEDYLAYIKKYSKMSNLDSFQYSGLLRPMKEFKPLKFFERVSVKKIKVLLISEPLVHISEIIPYLKHLLKNNSFEVGIKVRPMIQDEYYENMKNQFPEIKELKVHDGKLEDIADIYDVFIGSNSTAIIEASLFGKLSILLKTVKFDDYFDMNQLIQERNLLVENPSDLTNEIQFRVENEKKLKTINKIKYKFFGSNKDGAEWIINQLK